MEQELEKRLREDIGHLCCPKNFKCHAEGFENLCKAQDVGLATFLVCLEQQRPNDCQFSLPFGHIFLCECPLRVHIAKKLKK
jgi:hypothetical protein